ncbi:IS1249 family transposase [Arcanobacterium phocisimile]|uniref:IS1249 family transposase n=1 Tax=Arcanobacterium phocisimile TaxID=1302235 RepID=A0ABX7IG96_9ACTO|nr:IS1249 family transposase [Arcanobacterium phocisimile]QRV02143.1 IS1249 family transposase [Arcanobacterium phocisimile]
MNTSLCPICSSKMIRHGRTSRGRQRWRCKACGVRSLNSIDSTAKHLQEFLRWLLSGQRQRDMPGHGRSFRRRCKDLWSIWPLSPVVDEVHDVVFVDGIYLGRQAVVLIACSQNYVLGWYVARRETTRAWSALLQRIAPARVVVSDGGSGFAKALRLTWPTTRHQRCTFHVFTQIKQAITTRPKLQASIELYDLGKERIRVVNKEQAITWITKYVQWASDWEDFLNEKTLTPTGWCYTHQRLVKARKMLNKLIKQGLLFTFCDPVWQVSIPSMNNRIEGGVNASLRYMLYQHRGMCLTRRIKAIFWWCYMHTEHPLSPGQILQTMPTDQQINNAWHAARLEHQTNQIPQWGDAIVWSELHYTTPYHNTWD